MSEAPTGDHGYDDPRRRRQWGDDERRLVAHAAGAVLVDLLAGKIGEIEDRAAVKHLFGESQSFLFGHTDQSDRHQEGGKLVIGDGPVGEPRHEKCDFLSVELCPVSFATNDVDGSHDELRE